MRLLRANSVKPIHSIRFKYWNNPGLKRDGIRLLRYPQFQLQVGVPLAHKFKQDPRSNPYQYKRLPQAKQSRKVHNSLRPWFSGLNKDSWKDRPYGSVAWSPSTPGAGSNGPAPRRHSKMQKTRSHIESLFGVRNSSCRRKKKKRGKDFPLLRG